MYITVTGSFFAKDESPDDSSKKNTYSYIIDNAGIIRYLYEDSKNDYPFDVKWIYIGNKAVPYCIVNGDSEVLYEYENHCRTSKITGAEIIEYSYTEASNDGYCVLVSEKRDDYTIEYLYRPENEVYMTSESTKPVYDRHNLYGFIYNDETYEYIIDPKNDFVVGIKDSSGAQIVKYEYDVWKVSTVYGIEGNEWVDKTDAEEFVGNINRIRAWRYYFDTETEWYYCDGQYYDSNTGERVVLNEPIAIREN